MSITNTKKSNKNNKKKKEKKETIYIKYKEELEKYFYIKKDDDFDKIYNKIIDKIDELFSYFQNLIEGSSLETMIDLNNLNNNDKEEIKNIYKKLGILKKKSLLFIVNNNKKEQEELIVEIIEFFKNNYLKIERILKKIISSWEEDHNTKINIGYFG